MSKRGVKGSVRKEAELGALWTKALSQAERELGSECVTRWIRPVRLASVENDLAVLAANTGFLADWVERNYVLHLRRILQSLLPGLRRITLTVADTGPAADDGPAARAAEPASAESRAVWRVVRLDRAD